MIQRVWERVSALLDVGPAYVATDDQEQWNLLVGLGANCILTGEEKTGSDRCAAALPIIEALENKHFDFVINVQGDMPFVSLSLVRLVAMIRENAEEDVVSAVCPHSLVKADDAYWPEFDRINVKEHIGIYAFKRQALIDFHSELQSEKELRTNLEMNRMPLSFEFVDWPYMPLEVNTQEDVMRIEDLASALR